MIAKLLQPFLIALVGIFGITAGVQTLRLHHAQDTLTELQQSIHDAAVKSAERAAVTGQEAVTSYEKAQQQDAPTVDHVVSHVRNICLRDSAADHLPVPGTAAAAGSSSSKAQDDADRAAYVGAIEDDLRTCASELNRLDAIRKFHNDNVGAVK